MKTFLGWLADPYIHILLLGLVLLQYSVGYQAEEAIEAAAKPVAGRSTRGAKLTPAYCHSPLVARAGDGFRPD